MTEVLSTGSKQAWGTDLTAFGVNAVQANVAWPTANKAYFVPFVVPATITVRQMFYIHGNTTSGNIDIGIYSEDWAKLVSCGSTACSGLLSQPITIDVTDTALVRGRYYFAMAVDNNTATFAKFAFAATTHAAATGGAEMASAFPLPSTATPTLVGSANAFVIGYTTRTESI